MSAPTSHRASSLEPVHARSHAHTLVPPRRKLNGCYECSQRRIRCDKTEPHCQKCQKKGLECSGQGFRVRFTSGLVSKRKSVAYQLPAPSVPPAPSPIMLRWTTISARDASEQVSRRRHLTCTDFVQSEKQNQYEEHLNQGQSLELDASALESEPESVDHSDILSSSYQVESNLINTIHEWRSCYPSISTPIELSSPQTRRMLHHFSQEVAPVMVVLDCISNGYRDIILPLAIEDPIVSRAVSVVAAHHLAAKVPEMQKLAMEGQMAIISKLRRDSLEIDSSKQFSISNLATVLVLLVGDTVTGGNDFVHLLELLRCLTQSERIWEGLTDSVRQFFSQQARMFEFFGFPLSQERKGIQVLRDKQQNYLEFMNYSVSPFSKHFEPLRIMKAAISIASEVYRRRAESALTEEESFMLLQELREKTAQLHGDVDGTHALVWTYFVAAAESSLSEHREYFTGRLKELFHRTRFRSILVGIEMLPKLWSVDRRQRWTEILAVENPVLVM